MKKRTKKNFLFPQRFELVESQDGCLMTPIYGTHRKLISIRVEQETRRLKCHEKYCGFSKSNFKGCVRR